MRRSTGPRPAAAVLAAVLALLVLAGLLLTAPVRAQSAPTDPLELSLLRISGWSDPSHPADVTLEASNAGSTPIELGSVTPVLGFPLTSRTALVAAISGGWTGAAVLGPTSLSGLVLQPGASVALPPVRIAPPGYLVAGRQGAVLPLELEVQGIRAGAGPQLVDQTLDTFLVYLNGSVAYPVRLAMVVPVYAPTQRLPSGTYQDDALAAAIAPGSGPLAGVVRALTAHRTAAFTLVVDALTLRDVTDMTRGYRLLAGSGPDATVAVPASSPQARAARAFLRALRAAAARPGAPTAVLPYGNVDLTALVHAGQAGRAALAYALARSAVIADLGGSLDRSLGWPAGGLADARTLRTMAGDGIRTVLLDQRMLPVTAALTQSAPVNLAGQLGVPLRALVPDAGLSTALTDPAAGVDPALWSQRVLAETAMAWLESPGSPGPRGILLAPPQTWRPAPAFAGDLLGGLASAPWLRLEPASELARTVPPGPVAAPRPLAPYPASALATELPPSYLRAITVAERELRSFRLALGPAIARDGGAPNTAELARNLVIAQSVAWRPPATRSAGAAYAGSVAASTEAVYSKVVVAARTITLSAQNGTIPITVLNRGNLPLRIVIRLVSAEVGVSAESPGNLPFTLQPNSGFTQFLHVRTRKTGAFPITVQVRTPDGRALIAQGQVIVHSTAFNQVALVLTAGAGAFLLLWWLRRARRRRRAGPSGRVTADPVPPAAGPAAGTPAGRTAGPPDEARTGATPSRR